MLRDRRAKAGDPSEIALVRIDAAKFKEQLAGIKKFKEDSSQKKDTK